MTIKERSPAFQFYPQDYLSSARVATMTLEEEGVYIRLLCYCWSNGSIPADPVECAKLAGKGCSVETATNVQQAFNVCSTNVQRMIHDRLESEREKQKLRRKSCSDAGKKSASSRSLKSSSEPTKNKRSTNVQRKVNSSSSSSDEDDGVFVGGFNVPCFDDFWVVYPRRIGKQAAIKFWNQSVKKTDPVAIIDGAKRFAVECKGKEPQYIPHPATWLNHGRWDDEIEPPKKKQQFYWDMFPVGTPEGNKAVGEYFLSQVHT